MISLIEQVLTETLVPEFIDQVPQNATLLDVCCGTDTTGVMKKLIENNFRVIGIDISEKTLVFFYGNRKAVTSDNHYVRKINFLAQDVRTMGFQPETFDGLTAIYALDYFETSEFSLVFQSFFSVLKPEGLLLLSFGFNPEIFSEGMDFESYLSFVKQKVESSGFCILLVKAKPSSPYYWILARKPTRGERRKPSD